MRTHHRVLLATALFLGLTAPALAEGPTEYPAVSLEGLGDVEQQIFSQIVSEEICPCDCPKTFGACLQEGTRCGPAVTLAEWLVTELQQGVPGEILADQVAKEIAGGFSAKPKQVDIQGYAHKGASKPKFVIVEYADFECPHCKMASSVVDALVKRHPGEVEVVFKHFPLSMHTMAKKAAAAAEAAGLQGKFWEMHDAIFATQGMLDDALLEGHAKALGLDVKRFNKDRKSKKILDKVARSRAEGERIGIEATPTFLINGRPFNLMRTREAFEARLKMERGRAAGRCD